MIDYVVPDYYAQRPKACMGGWGRQFLAVSPAGQVLPCHAAESLPGFDFPNVREQSLPTSGSTPRPSTASAAPTGCRRPATAASGREIDWGGCRCQAFALLGDAAATDPACALSPDHGLVEAALGEANGAAPDFVYRGYDSARARATSGER